MDWSLAIHRNRAALLAVVASIAALIGGAEGGLIARRLRNAALALLRPAEAAVRRLILIAARGLVVVAQPAPAFAAAPGAGGGAGRSPAFRLFDPRQRFVLRFKAPPPRGVPRIRSFWGAPPAPPPPAPVTRRAVPSAFVAAGPLTRRLAALRRALADLPREARRLARWRVRRGARPMLRPGRPPGWRAGSGRAVDDVLRECHALARDALRGDTS